MADRDLDQLRRISDGARRRGADARAPRRRRGRASSPPPSGCARACRVEEAAVPPDVTDAVLDRIRDDAARRSATTASARSCWSRPPCSSWRRSSRGLLVRSGGPLGPEPALADVGDDVLEAQTDVARAGRHAHPRRARRPPRSARAALRGHPAVRGPRAALAPPRGDAPSPPGGWPANDVDLVIDEQTAWSTRPPRLPGRPATGVPRGASGTAWSRARLPFAADYVAPLDLVDPGRRLPAERRRRPRSEVDGAIVVETTVARLAADHRRAASRRRAPSRAPHRRRPPDARPRDVHDPAPHRDAPATPPSGRRGPPPTATRRRPAPRSSTSGSQRPTCPTRRSPTRPPPAGDEPASSTAPTVDAPTPAYLPPGYAPASRRRADDDRPRSGGPLVEQRAGVDPPRRHDRSDRRRAPRRHRPHRPPDPGRRRRRLHGPGGRIVSLHTATSTSPSPARSPSRPWCGSPRRCRSSGEALPAGWPQGDGLDALPDGALRADGPLIARYDGADLVVAVPGPGRDERRPPPATRRPPRPACRPTWSRPPSRGVTGRYDPATGTLVVGRGRVGAAPSAARASTSPAAPGAGRPAGVGMSRGRAAEPRSRSRRWRGSTAGVAVTLSFADADDAAPWRRPRP